MINKYRFLSSKLKILVKDAVQASKEGGHEICGLLVDNGYFIELIQCRNKSRKGGSFAFYQREVSRIQKSAEILNHEIVGTFHSHPFAGAKPGDSDLADAFDEELMLIIDVIDRGVALWHIRDKSKRKVQFELI